jgi:hypothetical protein
MVPSRVADETEQGIMEQLVGEVEVSRETGRIMSATLREPPIEPICDPAEVARMNEAEAAALAAGRRRR